MQNWKNIFSISFFSFAAILLILNICSCSIIFTSSENSMTSVNMTTASRIEEKPKEIDADATIADTTTVLKKGEPSIVIRNGMINPEHKQIALTFDSGWEYENSGQLLDILDKYNVKATFFTRGLWAKDHPEIAADIVNRGHDLENHSLTHGHMTEMSDEEVENEIVKTTNIIKDITGFNADLFRPPYGEYDERILRILNEAGYPYTILWTVDSHDWAKELNGVIITEEYVIRRVLENASDGGIILMHIGGYETVNALPDIIDGLKAESYYFVKVKEIL